MINQIVNLDDNSFQTESMICEHKNTVGFIEWNLDKKLENLEIDIQRLTNQADKFDYTMAILSGVLSGIWDSIFVGEFSLKRAKKWGDDTIDNFVLNIAKKQGYNGDSLEDAVRMLEKDNPIPSDSETPLFGGGLQHHLRDFAHHPTIVGWIFSLLTQFTQKVYGTDTSGRFIVANLENKKCIGEKPPQKILLGTVTWFFHLVSDMAGSSSSIHLSSKGTGLPGPLLSLAKELSSLPVFKKTNANGNRELSVFLSKLFNGTKLKDEDGNAVRLNLQTEIGLLHELKRQAVPIVMNTSLVRAFYFLRRITLEIKKNGISNWEQLSKLKLQQFLPKDNRTIARMLTISSSVFLAIDSGDAAIRSAIRSCGNLAAFGKGFLIRINYVGIGNWAFTLGNDAIMGLEKKRKEKERIQLHQYLLQYSTYYEAVTAELQATSESSLKICISKIAEYFHIKQKVKIISVPFSARKFRKMEIETAKQQLIKCGFKNICEINGDRKGLIYRLFHKNMAEIMIVDNRKFKRGDEFRNDAPILIIDHMLQKGRI